MHGGETRRRGDAATGDRDGLPWRLLLRLVAVSAASLRRRVPLSSLPSEQVAEHRMRRIVERFQVLHRVIFLQHQAGEIAEETLWVTGAYRQFVIGARSMPTTSGSCNRSPASSRLRSLITRDRKRLIV